MKHRWCVVVGIILLSWALQSKKPALVDASFKPQEVTLLPRNQDNLKSSVPAGEMAQPLATASPLLEVDAQERREIEQIRAIAKVNLSSFYSSQAAYFYENERYSTDLKSLGWAPDSEDLNFKMGFLSPFHPESYIDDLNLAEDPNRMSTDDILALEGRRYSKEASDINLRDFAHLCQAQCSATAKSFEMLLALPLGKGRGVDIWLINNRKELTLVRDGSTAKQ